MSILQRVVLVAGALAVVAVIYATPRVVIYNGKMYRDFPSNHRYASVVDVRTVGSILVGVVVVTIALFIAVSPKRRTRDRLNVVEDRVEKLTRDVAALESHVTEPNLSPSKSSP